jgi:hypothetical protein
MMEMNLADLMQLFEDKLRDSGITDENDVLQYMVKLHNLLVQHGMVKEKSE